MLRFRYGSAMSFSPKIKLYLDGADRAAMLEFANNAQIAGFTTNPSLMKKSGVRDYKAFCQEILAHIKKPISFEVFADDLPEMKRQAHEIASWDKGAKNVTVKIPVINTRGESTLSLARELSHAGIRLNITAIYTIEQIYETAQALAGGAPSIVSVFAGRIADSGRDPMPTMHAAAEICRAADAKSIELLWASTREVWNIVQAERAGCHIITAPADILKKMAGFGRSLEDLTLDTVKMFKADSEAAGFQL